MMKKITRNFILKTIVFLVFVSCFTAAAYICFNEIYTDDRVYMFEDSAGDAFAQQKMINALYTVREGVKPKEVVVKMKANDDLPEVQEGETLEIEWVPYPTPEPEVSPEPEILPEDIDKSLEYIRSHIDSSLGGQIDYYISLNGQSVSGKDSPSDTDAYKNAALYYNFNDEVRTYLPYYTIENGTEDYSLGVWSAPSLTDFTENYSEYRILIKPNAAYFNDFCVMWSNQKVNFERAFSIGLILILCALVCLIYLLWVCGRNTEDDEVHLLLIDRIYTEITLAMFAAAAIGFVFSVILITDEFFDVKSMGSIITRAMSAYTGIASAVIAALVMSLVRNLKNRSFIKNSLTIRILRICWKLLKWAFGIIKTVLMFVFEAARKILGWVFGTVRKIITYIFKIAVGILRFFRNTLINMRNVIFRSVLKEKFSLISVMMLIVYTAAVLFFTFLSIVSDNAAFFLIVCVIILLGIYMLAGKLSDFDKIQDGIFKIKGGNLDYKIEGVSGDVMGNIAEAVNSIGDGLSASVEKAVKAERMKSELITNVSHDLKTPLTSIINYSDILSNQELTPKEANDYVKIIQRKAIKLKELTSALFDLSKVQSGVEKVEMEKLDIPLLINQTLAEQEEIIKKSGLDFQLSLEENLYAEGNGKKLSAVFENLIVNAVKYSMKNTRVYISAANDKDKVRIEIKNIASYRMNFDGRDITGRFVRGDESRSGEGNGLGLAIAKSYVEVCGGKFEVIVDGDLFKVCVVLERV